MKKQFKTQKLQVKTETIRSLTEGQLENVAGGAGSSVVTASQTNNTARCNQLSASGCGQQ
ncbi:MAG: class I lanthipeptide [Deltaproteobacteria bacterium]|nr:class I lanthipeptide [Deltaproteobacteria bacterium]